MTGLFNGAPNCHTNTEFAGEMLENNRTHDDLLQGVNPTCAINHIKGTIFFASYGLAQMSRVFRGDD